MGFLDKAGLERLWGKVQAALSGKQDKFAGTGRNLVGFDEVEHFAKLINMDKDLPVGRIPYKEVDHAQDIAVSEIYELKNGQMLMLHFNRGTDWFYPLEFSINGKDQCQVYQFDSTGKSLEEFSAATTEATTLLLIFWDRKWILLREWHGSLEY